MLRLKLSEFDKEKEMILTDADCFKLIKVFQKKLNSMSIYDILNSYYSDGDEDIIKFVMKDGNDDLVVCFFKPAWYIKVKGELTLGLVLLSLNNSSLIQESRHSVILGKMVRRKMKFEYHTVRRGSLRERCGTTKTTFDKVTHDKSEPQPKKQTQKINDATKVDGMLNRFLKYLGIR